MLENDTTRPRAVSRGGRRKSLLISPPQGDLFISSIGPAVPPEHGGGGLRELIQAVSRAWGIPVADLVKDDRRNLLVQAREDFIARARAVLRPDGSNRYSLPAIGAFLHTMGRPTPMHHATVLHAERNHKRRRAQESE